MNVYESTRHTLPLPPPTREKEETSDEEQEVQDDQVTSSHHYEKNGEQDTTTTNRPQKEAAVVGKKNKPSPPRHNRKAAAQPPPAISKQEILGNDVAFILRGVLSPEECQFYIDHAEMIGLDDCGYSHSIRKTDRIAACSKPLERLLWERVNSFLQPINLATAAATHPAGIPNHIRRWNWKPIGLNETFRLCRYQPGGFFLPHHDGGFVRNEFERSLKTFMLYLNDNDDFDGGATTFYNSAQAHYCQPNSDLAVYTYQPRTGDAIVFNSAITHDGGKVHRGRKYILRSEVMYAPTSEGIDEEVMLGKDEISGARRRIPPDHSDFDIGDFVP